MVKVKHSLFKRFSSYAFALGVIFIVGCGGGGGGSGTTTPPPPAGGVGTTPQVLNVTINWLANREAKVNLAGGGYNVYISSVSGFNITDANVTLIPVLNVAGAQSPTSTITSLSSGTYYVRVAAFGLVNGNNTPSVASSQVVITVPFTTP
ncbi:hypothetical protein MNBD_GAMMA12-1212 [hydrothermal vent metagenome]|uniref:Fibronectin type-III domain-containing protein n=1 Tax=hydrothermal vent metagenome TaxID=652676 RepID=A0A3B0YW05_9ZZZZ